MSASVAVSAIVSAVSSAGSAAASVQSKHKLPVLYISHGGGPFPVLGGMGMETISDHLRQLRDYVFESDSVGDDLNPIKNILVISAHWEEAIATVSTSEKPPMLYDYYGFPPEAYKLKYPAPGSPSLASRIQALLSENGIKSSSDSKRGFDHGTFIPLILGFPKADIPVVQLSLLESLDPGLHLKIGKALEPLREEGTLIIGSGYSFHNMQGFFGQNQRYVKASAEFDKWLQKSILLASNEEERNQHLKNWLKEAPHARDCHPREEHLIPLMVCAGAGGNDNAHAVFDEKVGGLKVTSFRFGDAVKMAEKEKVEL